MPQQKESDLNLLFRKISHLHEGCLELEKIAPDFDFSAEVPGNGFRSFISLCSKFEKKVHQSVPTSRSVMQELNTAASTLVKILEVLRDMKSKSPEFDYTLITEDDIRIMEKMNTITPEDIIPFFSKSVGVFWFVDYCQKEQLQRPMFMELLSSKSWLNRLRLMLSPRFMAKSAARSSIASSPEKIQKVAMKFTQFPINFVLGFAAVGTGVTIKDIFVQKSNPFVIQVKDSKSPASISKSSRQREGKVRCLYLTPKRHSLFKHDGQSLMLHLHGGAFIAGKPEMFVPIHAGPCVALNVPVLSVDYGLAPDHKFPAPLQDLLDVYMWLLSGSDEVVQKLGFRPTKIILVGESSGANMGIALSFALLMINDLGNNVLMPIGMSYQSPLAVAAPIASPSLALLITDPLITTGMAAVSVAAYADVDPPAPDNWHRDTVQTQEFVERLKERIRDPLFNILAGDSILRLKDIPLSLMLCEFDPCLDQGIAIAKKWPNKPRVRIAKGMAHGLTFTQIEKAKKEFDWITKGIREMIEK